MSYIGLDFETHFAPRYSLSVIPPLLYVRDPRFKAHGCAVKINDDPAIWVTHNKLTKFFATIDWSNTTAYAHNALFDGLVLHEIYGHAPAVWVDTLGLSRALLPPNLDNDLTTLAQFLQLGAKGDELTLSKGLVDLPPDVEEKIAAYSINDIELTWGVMRFLYPHLPTNERKLMSMTIRWGTIDTLRVNRELLTLALQEAKYAQRATIAASGYTATQLRSAKQFPEIIRALGIEPPTKLNDKGNEAFALAKNDLDFIRLQAQYPEHRVLWDARIAACSNSTITRLESFLAMTERRPTLVMPLNYYGAHTGRWSGAGGMNVQNLERKSATRLAIEAPEGHVVVVVDSSQIELRVNAWFCNQESSLEILRSGEDIYSHTATQHFGYEVTKKMPERQFGKALELACLTGDTPVYTQRGMQPLSSIHSMDTVWDGESWVTTEGAIHKGWTQTLDLLGTSITPDHLVWCGTNWIPAESLAHDASTLYQALATASVSSPSLATNSVPEAASNTSWSSAVAVPQSTQLTQPTSGPAAQPGATPAQRNKPATGAKNTTATQTSSPTKTTAAVCSTASQQQFNAATETPTAPATTATEVLKSPNNGAPTDEPSCNTSSPLKVGTTLPSTWTASTTTAAMNPATSGSSAAKTTATTGELSNSSNKKSPGSTQNSAVYDLLNCGPNNRFTIATHGGPLIVHNCGYGMGDDKFQTQAAIGIMGTPPVVLTKEEASAAIATYRNGHNNIRAQWRWLNDTAIPYMRGTNTEPLVWKCVKFIPGECLLPNGMCLQYPKLDVDEEGQWTYETVAGRTKLYGALLLENIVQALARIVVAEQMLVIDADPRVTLVSSTHDEAIGICKTEDADEVLATMIQVFSTTPHWAPDLPLAAEGGYARNYSK